MLCSMATLALLFPRAGRPRLRRPRRAQGRHRRLHALVQHHQALLRDRPNQPHQLRASLSPARQEDRLTPCLLSPGNLILRPHDRTRFQPARAHRVRTGRDVTILPGLCGRHPEPAPYFALTPNSPDRRAARRSAPRPLAAVPPRHLGRHRPTRSRTDLIHCTCGHSDRDLTTLVAEP